MTSTRLEAGRVHVGEAVVLELDGLEPLADTVGPVALRSAVPRGEGVWELVLRLVNPTDAVLRIEAADALVARLPAGEWSTLSFTSAWGAEFEPVAAPLGPEGIELIGTSGRSSHGTHPWLGLAGPGGGVVVAPAWSGNWRIAARSGGALEAGLARHDFFVDLAPGQVLEAPSVLLAAGADIDDASARLATALGGLVPRSEWSDALPTEWNHWWPYEDVDIDQAAFLAEAEAAAALGLEVATLDAGWFGRPEAGSDWQLERGDWAETNTARFPDGVPALADAVRATGAAFGLWLEPEAVGAAARLRRDRPDLIATRSTPAAPHPNITVSLDPDDPTFLGYVCLGNPDGRAFVADTLERAVADTGARWLKLDFNIDPGSGCDRIDHGHGAGDGLLQHYLGLYAVLDAFRAAHPDVILEACSSGGLRLDAGLAQHVHTSFLSDPDWTEHHLQVLWGASRLLPPVAMLHWSWSQWRGDHPDQQVDWAALDAGAFDTMLRAALLTRFGVSMKLTELRPELADRLRRSVAVFRGLLAPLVRDGVLRPRTPQPLRHARGERAPVFQLDAPAGHLLAATVLPGGVLPERLVFDRLVAERRYRVVDPADAVGPATEMPGSALMRDGVATAGGTSALVLATPID